MYKIVFIDDEFLVVEGLKRMINWGKYNIKVAGSASNAYDGIKLIEEQKPDIVISDIRMHGKSGLDMISELVEKGFPGYMVLLSGYADFDYAKRAIENKVYRYLLKPVDVDELIDTMQKITLALDRNKGSLDMSVIQKVVADIDGHFHEDIQLSVMAEKYHFETAYLSRLLKKKLGMNYSDYVTKQRIDSAKKYIKETDLSFEEISARIGYNDVRRFRDMFKKYTAMTPSEYKKRCFE